LKDNCNLLRLSVLKKQTFENADLGKN